MNTGAVVVTITGTVVVNAFVGVLSKTAPVRLKLRLTLLELIITMGSPDLIIQSGSTTLLSFAHEARARKVPLGT